MLWALLLATVGASWMRGSGQNAGSRGMGVEAMEINGGVWEGVMAEDLERYVPGVYPGYKVLQTDVHCLDNAGVEATLLFSAINALRLMPAGRVCAGKELFKERGETKRCVQIPEAEERLEGRAKVLFCGVGKVEREVSCAAMGDALWVLLKECASGGGVREGAVFVEGRGRGNVMFRGAW